MVGLLAWSLQLPGHMKHHDYVVLLGAWASLSWKPRRFKASLSQGQNCKAQIAVASHHAVFATWNAHAAVEAFDTHPVNDEQLNASRILYHRIQVESRGSSC
uniref:Uncharacterized protein n=1 Tax=Chlamydomonas euryale TaxID=1486919 RepID=A0A7R9YTS3_9CHLO